jgi:hypothetical protein
MARKTTVHRTARGYYRATIPKVLGDIIGVGGRHGEWNAPSAKRCLITFHDSKPDGTSTKASPQPPYKLPVPKDIGSNFDLSDRKVEWSVTGGDQLEMRWSN